MKKELKKYLLVGILTLIVILATGCGATQYKPGTSDELNAFLPIAHNTWGEGTWDWLVFPMAWLMNFIGKYIVGYNYAFMIIITTILIRTIAWPIYGKTNDMSMKMNLMKPELDKLEKKYANRVDQESQQRKQMEQLALYKKYKVNPLGCLLPFIQMPIFLAFYETLRRLPFSSADLLKSISADPTAADVVGSFTSKGGDVINVVTSDLLYNCDIYNKDFLGINLLKDASEGGWQRWGIYIIAALVFLTQIGTQLWSQHNTKKQKASLESDVPEYRKTKENDQQAQTEKILKIMLYGMPVIMVIFIVQNTAALGFYWLVGNIYTALQTFISSKLSARKMEKLRNKYAKNDLWS